MTTQNYASRNIFKFGKTNNLLKTLEKINLKKFSYDRFYYCYFVYVYNTKEIEYEIYKTLNKFIFCKKNSLFIVNYDYFLEILIPTVNKINELYYLLYSIKKNINTINNLPALN